MLDEQDERGLVALMGFVSGVSEKLNELHTKHYPANLSKPSEQHLVNALEQSIYRLSESFHWMETVLQAAREETE